MHTDRAIRSCVVPLSQRGRNSLHHSAAVLRKLVVTGYVTSGQPLRSCQGETQFLKRYIRGKKESFIVHDTRHFVLKEKPRPVELKRTETGKVFTAEVSPRSGGCVGE